MNNSDMPAMAATDSNGAFIQDGMPSIGLTKREHFAGLAMQALISTIPQWEALGYPCPDSSETAISAMHHADSLLKALDNE